MLTVTSHSSECYVPSGLDFEAAGDSVVCYFVSNYVFASRASSRCKHDMGALSSLNAETVEKTPTPLFGILVRCSAHGPFFARLRYMHLLVLYALVLNWTLGQNVNGHTSLLHA